MCVTPLTVNKIVVPCGRCYECLIQRRSTWTVRNLIEYNNSVASFFCTITYDDENIQRLVFDPRAELYHPDKSHYQNLFKRLRKKLSFKYFLVHEYGSNTFRPHYHILFYFKEDIDIIYFKSLLSKEWTYGFIDVSLVTAARVHYCSKYLQKIVFNVGYNSTTNSYYYKRAFVRGNKDATYRLLSSYSDFEYRNAFLQTHSFNIASKGIGSAFFDMHDYISYYRSQALSTFKYPPLFIYNKRYPMPRYYIDRIFSQKERLKISLLGTSYSERVKRYTKLCSSLNLSIVSLKSMLTFASKNKIDNMIRYNKITTTL